jgi:hypothetical protein
VKPDSGITAADLATALSGKIPGVTSLVPFGPNSLFYSIDPSKFATPSAPAGNSPSGSSSTGSSNNASLAAKNVETRLKSLIERELPPVTIHLKVLDLPHGYGHACDIITAIGHQAPGVVSLSVIDDSRIMVGLSDDPEKSPGNKNLDELRQLVKALAIPTIAPAQPVKSVAIRLYYDRDANSVATVVGSAFSELKSSAISSSSTSAFNDTVVLADPTGDANVLSQAQRMVAQLDEPRPQLTVNAWSLQLSSDKQGRLDELVPASRRLAGGYNDALQGAIMKGWTYLNEQIAGGRSGSDDSTFLDRNFAGYLCSFAGYNTAHVMNTATLAQGFCPADTAQLQYGLGYTTLFDQSPPDLLRMFIVVAAAKKPLEAAEAVLDFMEKGNTFTIASTEHVPYSDTQHLKGCIQRDEDLLKGADSTRDLRMNLLNSSPPQQLGFECTRARLEELLQPNGAQVVTSFIGQFRAAVADFLFQNKMKAEYPNDFQPFLYPASAAALDATLTPIVDAFNQDLEVLQQKLQSQLTKGVPNNKHLSYTSNGLVTVKVVSGNQAQVQTQSLNYFPQNPTFKLEDFAAALMAGASPSTSGGTGTSTVAKAPLLGGSVSEIISAIAAYKAAQPAQVTAKVGSGLAMTVTPYTISSASGAELNVNVTYNENAAATISSDTTQSQASDDLNSRVSQHEVTTMVRMDALKFFEISTMQSVIARQKARWKAIDPVIEIPILDGLGYGVRRRPQVIYNQSVIFLEATIVPTAADLGNSLLIQYDKIAQGACLDETKGGSKEAHSPGDFCNARKDGQNLLYEIMDYHKLMVQYFAQQSIDMTGTVQTSPNLSFPHMLPGSVALENND